MRNERGQMLIDFCERNGRVSPTRGVKSLREYHKPGKHQEIEIDFS
jgi:hypothetical protein